MCVGEVGKQKQNEKDKRKKNRGEAKIIGRVIEMKRDFNGAVCNSVRFFIQSSVPMIRSFSFCLFT